MRPSRIGYAVLIVAALLVFMSAGSTVVIGPVVTLIIVGVVDGVVAWWRLRRTRIEIVPLRTVAAPPEVLTCSVSVTGCSTPVVVSLLAGRSLAARRTAGRVLIDPGPDPVRASFTYSRTHRRNYLDYRVVISTVGLATARRDELIMLDDVIYQGPAVADIGPLDPPLAAVEPELERLREYVPGDRWSRISWSALARTGSLHVRQEDPIVEELVVVVDLAPIRDDDRVAPVDVESQLNTTLGLAAAVVTQGLRTDRSVRLVTYEPPPEVFDLELAIAARRVDGRQPKPDRSMARGAGVTVSEVVADATEMNRRLAVADVGPVEQVPPPHVRVYRKGVAYVR